MKNTLLQLLFLLTLTTLSATAQFCFVPQQPQADQVVSFTYTPQTTPLATDSTLEGRFVRYGAPNMMRISQPTTVTLVRQGNDYVGRVYLPKKDVAGTMLYFRNSTLPKRTDLNKGQFYVIPVSDANGRIVPHATGGQASVFTRTHLPAEAGFRPDQNWVVTLLEHELAQNPDLRPQYWYDLLAAKIKQRKPGYGPQVKSAIESYLASRPEPSPTELADAARLYESMGDFAKVKALRERRKSAEPTGTLVQKDRAMAIRTEPNWARKKEAYAAFRNEFPTSTYLPALTIMMTDDYYKQNDIAGMMAFVGQQPDNFVDALMLNTIAFKMADERRSVPEAEQLTKRALTVLKNQAKPTDVSGDWPTEKQIRHRQLMNTYARALEQQGKYADAYTAYQDVLTPDTVNENDSRTIERYFQCALRTNHGKDALPVVEEAVQLDKATKSLKATLHDWYAKQPGNTTAKADAYLADLEADVKAENGRKCSRNSSMNRPPLSPSPTCRAYYFDDGHERESDCAGFLGYLVRPLHCLVSGHAAGADPLQKRPERPLSVRQYPRGWPGSARLQLYGQTPL